MPNSVFLPTFHCILINSRKKTDGKVCKKTNLSLSYQLVLRLGKQQVLENKSVSILPTRPTLKHTAIFPVSPVIPNFILIQLESNNQLT